MTPELQRYYDAQFTMMASEGWKDFCEDLQAIVKPLKMLETATPDNLQNRQGRLAEINLVLNRREQLSEAYESLLI